MKKLKIFGNRIRLVSLFGKLFGIATGFFIMWLILQEKLFWLKEFDQIRTSPALMLFFILFVLFLVSSLIRFPGVRNRVYLRVVLFFNNYLSGIVLSLSVLAISLFSLIVIFQLYTLI